MKKSIKNKLKQLAITTIIIILSSIIGYIILQNQDSAQENISNETIQSNESNITNKTDVLNQTNTTNNTNIGLDNLPSYSDKIVITINNDIPYFEEKDITTEEFEYYSNLDEYDRAGVAFANICKFTMPPEGAKRGSLSYKPTGWEQYLYGENNKEHLYERCHLIAWKLGNENNNKKNLITGTSQMNAAMIEYEKQVANWVEDKKDEGKDYHVLYRVTPIYKGKNKLASRSRNRSKISRRRGYFI